WVLREPLQRVADARAIEDAGANSADQAARVQRQERTRVGVDRPGDADEDASGGDQPSRAEAIDEVALEWHEPRLGQHEHGEGDLECRLPPMKPAIDRIDEERPAVLEI